MVRRTPALTAAPPAGGDSAGETVSVVAPDAGGRLAHPGAPAGGGSAGEVVSSARRARITGSFARDSAGWWPVRRGPRGPVSDGLPRRERGDRAGSRTEPSCSTRWRSGRRDRAGRVPAIVAARAEASLAPALPERGPGAPGAVVSPVGIRPVRFRRSPAIAAPDPTGSSRRKAGRPGGRGLAGGDQAGSVPAIPGGRGARPRRLAPDAPGCRRSRRSDRAGRVPAIVAARGRPRSRRPFPNEGRALRGAEGLAGRTGSAGFRRSRQPRGDGVPAATSGPVAGCREASVTGAGRRRSRRRQGVRRGGGEEGAGRRDQTSPPGSPVSGPRPRCGAGAPAPVSAG